MNIKLRFRIALIILVCTIAGLQVHGQAKVRKQANQLYLSQNYTQALDLYNIYKQTYERPNILLRKAICEYKIGQIDASITSLNGVINLEKSLDEPYYYLGLCHIDLGKYEEAADLLKTYLNKSPKIDPIKEQEVLSTIKQCEYGTRLKYANQYAYIENMGNIVNTPYNEISPVQSPNFQNKYYFSSDRDIASGGKRDDKGLKNDYTGKYYYDMFAVELVNGNWTSVYPFNALQNTSRNEIIQDFSKSGDAMFYIKRGAELTGELLVDTFNLSADRRVFPTKFSVPIHAEIGDKDISMFKDNIILFASKRDGGYGGYDLYITQKVEDKWIDPINLGPQINTAYDEASGYITKGGNFLYFSSNRPESLGGFDIFRSEYFENNWSTPTNLGVPINSSRDDKDIFVSFDGTQGVFSSNRPNGIGGFDLYIAYWKDQVIDQLNYTESLDFMVLPDTSQLANDSILNVTAVYPSSDIIPKVKIDYINTPLYYDPNQDLISPNIVVALKNLTDFDKVYPGATIQLLTHTANDNLKEFNLFFGIKRGEKIKDYLISKGFTSDRISVISAGSSYPILKDQSNIVAKKYHNRIDLKINDTDPNYVAIIEDFPAVNNDIKSSKFDDYLKDLNLLSYRIKIAETAQMLRGNILDQDQPFIVIKENDKLAYYIGAADNYNTIKDLKNKLSKLGLTDLLEITPFIGYQKISDITLYQEAYPDLILYREFGQ